MFTLKNIVTNSCFTIINFFKPALQAPTRAVNLQERQWRQKVIDDITTSDLSAVTASLKIYLQQEGANINVCFPMLDNSEWQDQYHTFLTLAVKHQSIPISTLLLHNGSHINQPAYYTPVMLAVSFHDIDMLTFLLENHADPDSKAFVHQPTPSGSGAGVGIIGAIQVQRLDILELLLQYNADIHICAPMYRGEMNALCYATWEWEADEPVMLQLIQLLVDKGAQCTPRELRIMDSTRTTMLYKVFAQSERLFPPLPYFHLDMNYEIKQYNTVIQLLPEHIGVELAQKTPFNENLVSIIGDYVFNPQGDKPKILTHAFKRVCIDSKNPIKISSQPAHYLVSNLSNCLKKKAHAQ